MPPEIPALNDIDGPRPWTFVADLYRVWTGLTWAVADPQPTLADGPQGWTWPGTPCESRGHHSLEQVGDVTVCEDCHRVTV